MGGGTRGRCFNCKKQVVNMHTRENKRVVGEGCPLRALCPPRTSVPCQACAPSPTVPSVSQTVSCPLAVPSGPRVCDKQTWVPSGPTVRFLISSSSHPIVATPSTLLYTHTTRKGTHARACADAKASQEGTTMGIDDQAGACRGARSRLMLQAHAETQRALNTQRQYTHTRRIQHTHTHTHTHE